MYSRYKKAALKSYAAIEAELLQKNYQIDKEVADTTATEDQTMFSTFMSAYWLVKHKVTNSKLLSLLQLL